MRSVFSLLPILAALQSTWLTTNVQAAPPPDTYDCKNLQVPVEKELKRTYDLSALDKDFIIETSPEGYDYANSTWVGNICKGINTESLLPKEKEKCPAGTWLCWSSRFGKGNDHPPKQLAKEAPEPKARGKDILDLIFPKVNDTAITVSLICEVGKSGDPKVTKDTPSQLTIEWTHPAACMKPVNSTPKGGNGSSTFGIFCWVVFVLFCVYLVVGTMYSYIVLRIRTFPAMLPNWDFWSTLLATVWDFFASLYERITGRNYVRI
ncbi:hypothetical protein DFS34DRAFT_188642 [Phlyctochytrium arcticum]|nr:hypothetical protein DFS34DRAFT_188642 [Phlyctochytrium arcticum]